MAYYRNDKATFLSEQERHARKRYLSPAQEDELAPILALGNGQSIDASLKQFLEKVRSVSWPKDASPLLLFSPSLVDSNQTVSVWPARLPR